MKNGQSPFWNQDAIMAAGLAFAGLASLQSKLFASAGRVEWLRHIMSWPLIQWWPLLLIVAGVALWIGKRSAGNGKEAFARVELIGGQRGTRKRN